MPSRKKKALGRGMSHLVGDSLSSVVKPRGPARAAPSRDKGRAQAPKAARETQYHVVSIASGKGGTGKSVLASNLAVLLAEKGRVTILDADLSLANIHILYNLMPEFDVSHLISGKKSLKDILMQGPRGVNVIPGGSGVPELATLSQGMFGSFADGIAFLHETTDLLLVDAPSGLDRQALTFLLASDQVLVVTTEGITAMTDAYAVVKSVLTRRPNASVVIVVNQARSYAEGMETFQKIAHVARKFLGRELALGGIIPFDEAVERSVAERVPVTISHPASPAARSIVSVAGRVSTFFERSRPPLTPFVARLKGLVEGGKARAVRGQAR
ncbi:MAG: MinD/ParA family protein [Acidobacteriota bacterium]